jgi:lysine 6-dehydrogenase
MKTVVILGGAGAMSQTTNEDLLAYGKDIRVVIADKDVAKAEQRAKELASDKASAQYVDLDNDESVRALLKNADVVMNCALSKYNLPVMKAALSTKTHYMDLSALPQTTLEQMKLDDDFRKAGLLAIIGIGAAPGITNLMAKFAYDRLDTVESVRFRIAVKSMVKYANPIRFGYSPYGYLGQVEHKSMLVENGELKEVDSLTGEELAEFSEPLGPVETVYLSHPEAAMVSKTFAEKGLRFADVKLFIHPDFKEKLKFFRDLGLVSSKPTVVGEVEINPREIISHFITQLPVENLEPQDVGSFVVRVHGEKGGKRLEYVVEHVSASRNGVSSSAIRVGIPIAVAAHMMIDEGFPIKGALTPEACMKPETFFRELAKRDLHVSYRVQEFI